MLSALSVYQRCNYECAYDTVNACAKSLSLWSMLEQTIIHKHIIHVSSANTRLQSFNNGNESFYDDLYEPYK